ncbi:GntR family transcriptional regulator [Alkalihalobacillus sp. 1P02AB]|uniref:GntR family transcriptional regulator n=1 Tax=Alkalihalobacillus sp. 1P02AB TaxID=3132260 RepID=UPI0039A7566F
MNKLMMQRGNRYSTRDFVYEIIRERIMTLDLAPGSSISEKEIADELEVSRTPVREAFLKLSEDELLQILPQKGSFVTLIDIEHAENARFMREHLEVAMIRLACEKITNGAIEKMEMNLSQQEMVRKAKDEEAHFQLDQDFHRLISEGTDKLRVWGAIQKMNIHLNRILKLSINSRYNWDVLTEHHRQLFTAIKEKDQESAEKIMREHLRLVSFDQYEIKQKHPEYFN